MDRRCGINRENHVVICCEAATAMAAKQRKRDEAAAACDAKTIQSSVSGLNRAVSMKKDEPPPVTLDESKTNNKSLCSYIVVRCEASIAMDEAIRRREAARAMDDAKRCEAEVAGDAERCDAGVANDAERCESEAVSDAERCEPEAVSDTERCEPEAVSDAERCEAEAVIDVERCEAEAVSDVERCEAGVASDANTVQSPVSGLNRTISVKRDESLPVTLNKSKTNNKSLSDRIRGLSLVRKFVGFFEKMFRSKKVIDSVDKKGGETVASAPVASTGKLPVDFEWCVKEVNSLLDEVNNLGKAIAVEDPPFDNWQDAKTSLEELALRSSLLGAYVKEVDGGGHLNKKMAKMKMCLDWIRFHTRDSKSGDDYAGRNMRYYNAVLKCYHDAAKVALEDSAPVVLRQLENFYQQSGWSIENEVNNGDAFTAMNNLEMFGDHALELVDSVDQRDKYKQEFLKRQPVRVPGVKR